MTDPATTSVSRTAAPPCSIAATLEVIGDRWALLILRDVFRGVRRFAQLQTDLRIAKNILSDRLHRLVEHGVLEQVQYQDRPVRHEYRLTAKGADLSASLVAIMQWGDRWYTDTPPTVLVHDDCGTALRNVTRCPRCNEEISPAHIVSRRGEPPTTRIEGLC